MLREDPESYAVPGEQSRVCGHFYKPPGGKVLLGWPRVTRVQELAIVSKGNLWVKEAGACVTLGTHVYVGGGRSVSWTIR